jgi:hypothetical protein
LPDWSVSPEPEPGPREAASLISWKQREQVW